MFKKHVFTGVKNRNNFLVSEGKSRINPAIDVNLLYLVLGYYAERSARLLEIVKRVNWLSILSFKF